MKGKISKQNNIKEIIIFFPLEIIKKKSLHKKKLIKLTAQYLSSHITISKISIKLRI